MLGSENTILKEETNMHIKRKRMAHLKSSNLYAKVLHKKIFF